MLQLKLEHVPRNHFLSAIGKETEKLNDWDAGPASPDPLP